MIQQSLAAVMEKLNVGVNTDNNLFVNIRQERENHLVEMNNDAENSQKCLGISNPIPTHCSLIEKVE